MKQLNGVIVILFLGVIGVFPVWGKLMPVVEQSPDLTSVTAKIIKSCYGEQVKEIGIAGNISDSFFAALSSGEPIATVLINSNERAVEIEAVSRWSRHKLHVFAITAGSPLELKEILVDIKNSRWWNHMAQFYIIDSSAGEAGCSEAFRFLWTAWMTDILGAKFVCNQKSADGPLIYTFNPYTNRAPVPWKLEQTYKGVNDHPWTLFVRKYHERLNMCENIDFDPTREVAGYEARLTTSEFIVFPNATRVGPFSPWDFTNVFMQVMSRYMNITFKFVLHERNKSIGFIDNDGKVYGRLRDLTEGRSDFVFVALPLSAVPQLPRAYLGYDQFYAVTQYTGYPTQWQKVMSAIDKSSRIGVCIVIIANVIIFKFVLRQFLTTAILNTIRLICNSCLTQLPNNLGRRIYLGCLFCFVVVIQALYQGQLAALLAKHVRLPNINNRDDLVKSSYVIYGWHNESAHFSDSTFEGRFVGIDFLTEKCTDYVLSNSSIVCVCERQWLIHDAVKAKLHMSKHPVLEVPVSFLLRKDWPLEERFNRHISHYIESGLYDYDYEKSYADFHRILDSNENAGSHEGFKVLTPSDLDFAFVILGIGLACASISFLVELYIGRKRLRPKASTFCDHLPSYKKTKASRQSILSRAHALGHLFLRFIAANLWIPSNNYLG